MVAATRLRYAARDHWVSLTKSTYHWNDQCVVGRVSRESGEKDAHSVKIKGACNKMSTNHAERRRIVGLVMAEAATILRPKHRLSGPSALPPRWRHAATGQGQMLHGGFQHPTSIDSDHPETMDLETPQDPDPAQLKCQCHGRQQKWANDPTKHLPTRCSETSCSG